MGVGMSLGQGEGCVRSLGIARCSCEQWNPTVPFLILLSLSVYMPRCTRPMPVERTHGECARWGTRSLFNIARTSTGIFPLLADSSEIHFSPRVRERKALSHSLFLRFFFSFSADGFLLGCSETDIFLGQQFGVFAQVSRWRSGCNWRRRDGFPNLRPLHR